VSETFALLLAAGVSIMPLSNRTPSTNGTLIYQSLNFANLPVCDMTANKSLDASGGSVKSLPISNCRLSIDSGRGQLKRSTFT
jgi:hypothetical protein